jgi:hypothetical protein
VKTSSRDRCASKKKPDHTKHGERDHQILGIPELRVHEPPTVTVKENVRSVFGLHLTAQSIVTAQQLTGSLGSGAAATCIMTARRHNNSSKEKDKERDK